MESLHEEWRAVAGKYAGWQYEVSTHGNVRRPSILQRESARGHCPLPGRMLSQKHDPKGYPTVTLYRMGEKAGVRVHRIVAETFIPKVCGKPFVNHIDCNKQNNCASNLEWCTAGENIRHARAMGRYSGHRRPGVHSSNRKATVVLKAAQRSLIKERLLAGFLPVELASEFRVSRATIGRIANHKHKRRVFRLIGSS